MAFERFAKEAGPDDVIFVTLIGHGSFSDRTARFNLPGRDMSAADFNAMLRSCRRSRSCSSTRPAPAVRSSRSSPDRDGRSSPRPAMARSSTRRCSAVSSTP